MLKEALPSAPLQGLQFLPKSECDVREVEVARALRLRHTSIEPIAFRVPRVKVGGFRGRGAEGPRLDPPGASTSAAPTPPLVCVQV